MSPALFDRLREVIAPRGLGADADVQRIVHEAAGVVAMALDRGAAHVGAPADYPLPAPLDALEHVFAARVASLPADQRQALVSAAQARLTGDRARYYGSAGSLDLRGALPLVSQALNRAIPADLAPIAARAKDKLLAHAHASPIQERAQRLVQPHPAVQIDPGTPPQILPTSVELRVVEVQCLDDTSEVLRDEIAFGAVVQDLFSRDPAVISGPIDLGKHKRNEAPVPRSDLVHTYALVPHARFDHSLTGLLFLAEQDFGGFGRFLRHNGAVSDREMHQLVTVAITLLAGALSGVVAGAWWFVGFGFESALGALGLGLAGGILGALAAVAEVAAAALLLVVVIAVIAGLLRDEIFHQVPVTITISPSGTIVESGGPEYRQDVFFDRREARGNSARYRVRLDWRLRMGLVADPPPEPDAAPPTVAPDSQTALRNLSNIDHIVVLMLENRSFDHMLGYLALEGVPVDGLTPAMSNTLNGLPTGVTKRVFALPDTEFLIEPGHSFCAVRTQMGISDPSCRDGVLAADEPVPRMTGFVAHFAGEVAAHVDPSRPDLAVNRVTAGDIMGYHSAAHVPIFDQLAREFGVCDRWFSSFPGNTWVNRTIAFTGRPAKRASGEFITNNDRPKFEQSLFRLLPEDVSWAFYSQDVPTLLAVDSGLALDQRKKLFSMDEFLAHADKGLLPKVSWIDPNFIDVGRPSDIERFDSGTWFVTTCNDDHPPADIAHGQVLVATIFSALFRSRNWDRTLFVVLHDEHGGFFDHVPPPPTPQAVRDDEENDRHFSLYGARVPALVISPRVGRGLIMSQSNLGADFFFDHASLMKTIFLRFADDVALPPRIAHAQHLGWLLNEPRVRFPFAAEGGPSHPIGIQGPIHLPERRRDTIGKRMAVQLGGLLSLKPLSEEPARAPTDLQQHILDMRSEYPELKKRR